MNKIIRIALFLLLSFALQPAAAQDDPAPYLYYYSRMLGGIIIERADGSDSRHIGADVIPPNLTGIIGPGWSPSGRFFAAYPLQYQYSTDYTGSPYVIDAQQSWDVPWPKNYFSIYKMQWLSDSDLLLIIGSPGIESSASHNIFFWLVDPVSETVLTTFDASLGFLSFSLSDIFWDETKEELVFYIESELFVPQRYFRITMNIDGTVVKEPVTETDFAEHYQEFSYPNETTLYNAYGVSPSGRYEASGKRPTRLLDTMLDVEMELPDHSQGTNCRGYLWSANEQYIITMDGTLVSGGGCAAAVMGITDIQGNLWRELGGCSWDVQSCVNWMPSNVDVEQLLLKEPDPVQLGPVAYESADVMFFVMSYGNPALNLRCDGSVSNIVDSNTTNVLFTLDDAQDCPYNPEDGYADIGIPIVTAYDPTHQLLATYTDYFSDGYVAIWKMCLDGVGVHLMKLNTYGYELEFTSDGQQLRARNVNAWKIYDVDDILAAATADCEAVS